MEPAWLSVLAPFVGVGLIHNSSNKTSPFAFSYGIQGQYRISKRVSAVLEFSGTTTSQKFDGYGRTNRLGDHMVSLRRTAAMPDNMTATNERLLN